MILIFLFFVGNCGGIFNGYSILFFGIEWWVILWMVFKKWSIFVLLFVIGVISFNCVLLKFVWIYGW